VRIFNAVVSKIIDAGRAYVDAKKFKETTDAIKDDISSTKGGEREIERRRDKQLDKADEAATEVDRLKKEKEEEEVDVVVARDRLKDFVAKGESL
jgi:hypothetical protein